MTYIINSNLWKSIRIQGKTLFVITTTLILLLPCVTPCYRYKLAINELNRFLQHAANSILLLTANALGLTSYFVDEKQQRRAFLETRQSLEVKLVIEEQSAEQVRKPLITVHICDTETGTANTKTAKDKIDDKRIGNFPRYLSGLSLRRKQNVRSEYDIVKYW